MAEAAATAAAAAAAAIFAKLDSSTEIHFGSFFVAVNLCGEQRTDVK